MKHEEGLHISLVDESMLDSAGILTGNVGCTNAYGLPAESVRLFLLIATAGADGLPVTKLPKDLQADLAVHMVPLELQQLVTWERDKRGKLAFLVLTWQGDEAIAAARPSRTPHNSAWAARRRAVNSTER